MHPITMRHLALPLLLASLTPATAQTSGAHLTPVTLASMRDRYRPLLIFAPSSSPVLVQQLHTLAQGTSALLERDVLLVPILTQQTPSSTGVDFNVGDIGIMSPHEQTAARLRFHIAPTDFTVILLGKDGGEKLRSSAPLSLDSLRSTIDAMPMRQDELRTHPKP